MCGIITIITREIKTTLPSQILSLYKMQKSRGEEGFGFVAIDNKLNTTMQRAEEEKTIEEKLLTFNKKNLSCIIFHHRYPTSTPNYEEMAHPIKVKNRLLKNDYYVIHNGVISNDEKLHTEHKKEGFKYTTEMTEITKTANRRTELLQYNDSECLAIEIAKMLEAKDRGEDITLDTVSGSVAFIALQTTKNGKALKLYYGRNSQSPLKISGDSDNYYLASEGKGEDIAINTLYELSMQTMDLKQTPCIIGKYSYTDYKYNPSDWEDYDYDGEGYERREQGYPTKAELLDDMCYSLIEGEDRAEEFYPEMYTPDLLDIDSIDDTEELYRLWEIYDKQEQKATARGHKDTADWYYSIKIELESRLYEQEKNK